MDAVAAGVVAFGALSRLHLEPCHSHLANVASGRTVIHPKAKYVTKELILALSLHDREVHAFVRALVPAFPIGEARLACCAKLRERHPR
jgi:hypothetical protein